MKSRKKVLPFVFLFVILSCSLYLYAKATYTSYESQIEGTVSPNIAKWNIEIDGTSITDVQVVDINDISWDTSHVKDGKVAPGSSGVMNITIDPTDSDVAIRYELKVVDQAVDPLKLLSVSSITASQGELVRTAVDTYTGIISLADYSPVTLSLNVAWLDDDTDREFEDQEVENDDFIVLEFSAFQYHGEEIVPYVG